MKKTDIGVVGVVYAIALFFLVMTRELPKQAQAYPLFIIVLLLGLTTLYVIQMVLAAKKHGIQSGIEDFKGFLPKQFFPILGMMIAYLVIMYFVGFYIATLLFMVSCLLFLKVKKWQIFLSTVVILLLVYSAFTLFLGVKLPMGILFT